MGSSFVLAYDLESTPEADISQTLVQSAPDGEKALAGSSALSLLFAQTALDREMPLALRPIIGVWLISFLALKTLESGKHTPATGFLHYCKERLVDTVGVPLYVAYDRIKHEGPSKKDLAILGIAVLGLYSAKKCGERYHLGSSITRLDFSESREILSHDASFLWQYKGRIALGLAAASALACAVKYALNLPIIERFMRSLTRQQKEIISSDESLRQLVDKAHENPAALIDHDQFTSHLQEHQKKLLGKAVQQYKSEADPMSLFDDFVTDEGDLS